MKIGKINHFERGVMIQINHSDKVANTTYFRQSFVNLILSSSPESLTLLVPGVILFCYVIWNGSF